MSAFSNWNGPDCCPPGMPLPIWEDLKKLDQEITNIKKSIEDDEKALTEHIADDVATDNVHAAKTAINSAIGTLDTAIKALLAKSDEAPFSDTATVRGAIDAVSSRVTALDNALSGYATSGAVNAKFTAVDKAATALAGRVTVVEEQLVKSGQTPFSNTNTVRGAIDDVVNSVTALSNKIFDTDDNVKHPIKTDKDIYTGRIKAKEYLDFDMFKLFSATIYPIANVTHGNAVALLGELSFDFDRMGDNKPIGNGAFKPGTLFVKFVNTMPWNAIIDASCTPDSSDATGFKGGLSVLAAKTADRLDYPASGGIELPPLRFGIYKGTDAQSKVHIYVGVILKETYGPTYGSQPVGSTLSFYASGVNLLPFGTDTPPTGAVHEITHIDISENGQLSATNLKALGSIEAEEYKGTDGTNIWRIEADGDLSLGDVEHNLVLYSTNRPTVEHADYSKHEIAYLTDLAQSIYWQKSVDYIFDTIVAANGSLYYVDDAGNPVSPGTAGATAVRGVYTSNPYNSKPTAKAFEIGDMALLRVGGATDATIADGKYNGIFVSGPNTCDTSKITGISDKSMIKVGTSSLSVIDGTILVDLNGQFAKVTSDPFGAQTFFAIGLATAPFFAYDKPAYATYQGSTQGFVKDSDIDIPETFDGYITDISYEWSGMAATPVSQGSVPYYHDTYATWTAHHQNNVTMDYSGNAWDYVSINLEGYRTSILQDRIDDAILSLATTQSDYAENETIAEYPIPDRNTIYWPNPAYIHNRPWTGLAVIDGGSFTQPLQYTGWLVDGGDFTGMVGGQPPSYIPPVAPDNQFRNVINKIFRGEYADMPEVAYAAQPAVWSMFAWTLRWVTDRNELVLNDGTNALKRIPSISSLKNGTALIQDVAATGDTALTGDYFKNLILSFLGTNFPGSDPSVAKTRTIKFTSTDTNTDDPTIEFKVETDADGNITITMSSPRIWELEHAFDDAIGDKATGVLMFVPAPASIGTFKLVSTDGVLSWEADT